IRERLSAAGGPGPGAHLCSAARAGGKWGQHRVYRPSGAADRKDTLAEHSGRLPGDRLRASRRHAQRGLWTTPGGSFRCRRDSAGATNQAAKSGGKDGGCATLENAARFPLFHRSGGDEAFTLNLESGHFTCYKKRTSSRANDRIITVRVSASDGQARDLVASGGDCWHQ